ncbi:MAG TPA: phage tail assembly chaperone [Caulobacteraceae bacterium]
MNWEAMLRAAMAAGIAPGGFWRLSVKEWRALCRGGGEGLGRGELNRLMGLYPDDLAQPENLGPRFRGDER